MCLQQTDLTSTEISAADGGETAKAAKFVVSLFGARDDIKAHYTADRARVCGATWEAFLGYAGATAEDVWGGVDEADRKLWSVSASTVKGRVLRTADFALRERRFLGLAFVADRSRKIAGRETRDIYTPCPCGYGMQSSMSMCSGKGPWTEQICFPESRDGR